MPQFKIFGAAIATAVLIAASSHSARADLVAGLAGTVSGAVGSTVGAGSAALGVGINAGAAINGPGQTLGAGPSSLGGSSIGAPLSGGFGGGPMMGGAGPDVAGIAPHVSSSMQAAIGAAQRQRIVGTVAAVNGTTVRINAGGKSRTLAVSPGVARALRGYVGKTVALRSPDGSHATELVGRADVTRATVTGIDNGYVSYVTPGRLTSVAVMSPANAAKLRVGQRIVASTADFGRSMQIKSLGVSPASTLADVYLGRVVAASNGTATLSMGSRLQQFGADAAVTNALRARLGRVVAVDVPDGANIKSLVATPLIPRLVRPATNAPLSGVVVAQSANRLGVQLPNGDIRTFAGPVASLNTRVGAVTRIAALDKYQAKVSANGRAATLADADVCVTLNASCAASTSGHVVAVTPTSVSVRMGNGDVRSYVGNAAPLGAYAGVPVTVTPLDSTHARLVAGGNAAGLMDAGACVTINSGCNAVAGSIHSSGNGRTVVSLPDGSQTTISGAFADASVGSPIELQPLDNSNMVAMASGSLRNVTSTDACATLNGSCASANGRPPMSPIGDASGGNGSGGNGSGGNGNGGNGNGGNGNGGNGNGGNGNGGNGNGGNGNGGNGNSSSGGTGGGFGPGASLLDGGTLIASAFAPADCGGNGQIIARASDESGRPVAGALVHVWGPAEATVTTGADGRATLLRLPLGAYGATIQRTGYRAGKAVAVTVSCTAAALVDARLVRPAARVTATVQTKSVRRMDKAAARRAVTTSHLCMRSGKHVACAKPR